MKDQSNVNHLRLPDFDAFFWAKEIQPLHFAVRDWPNLPHDILFLSSFLHDASFESDIIQDKSKATIKLDRDCWEIGYGKNPYLPNVNELPWAISELILESIEKITWENEPRRADEMFYINQVAIGERTWNSQNKLELILVSSENKIRFLFSDFSPRIELRDLDGPFFGERR